MLVVGLACGLFATTAGVSGGAGLVVQDVAVSRAETEARVKQDLAQRLKVRPDQIRVITASDRMWEDATFGCVARKGLVEPMPIPGFAFTLDYGGKQYAYHTDRNGRFRRCDTGKPRAPITRN